MTKQFGLKWVGVWAMFLILHYTYEYIPIFPLNIISGTRETNFEHMKIGFFAYLFVSVIEYAFMRKALSARAPFLFSRLFAVTFFPWLMVFIWYMGPALFGPMPVLWEIIFANTALILAIGCALVIEQVVAAAPIGRGFKAVVGALFIFMLVQCVIFTYKPPWADLFTEPSLDLTVFFDWLRHRLL